MVKVSDSPIQENMGCNVSKGADGLEQHHDQLRIFFPCIFCADSTYALPFPWEVFRSAHDTARRLHRCIGIYVTDMIFTVFGPNCDGMLPFI